jgi:hypothetical protein
MHSKKMTGLKSGLYGRLLRPRTQIIAFAKYTGSVSLGITFGAKPRLIFLFCIVGAMAGYHSALAIHPGTGYGVVVFLGGNYFDATKLAYDTFEIFQPAIDGVLAEMSTALYAGSWISEEGNSSASIVVEKGTLYVERFISNGTNVLGMFHAPGRLALRSSQRRDEFRSVLCRHSKLPPISLIIVMLQA